MCTTNTDYPYRKNIGWFHMVKQIWKCKNKSAFEVQARRQILTFSDSRRELPAVYSGHEGCPVLPISFVFSGWLYVYPVAAYMRNINYADSVSRTEKQREGKSSLFSMWRLFRLFSSFLIHIFFLTLRAFEVDYFFTFYRS